MNTFLVQSINRHRLVTDGEGVTSLIGLKGCPLRCKYCINMDILSKEKQVEMTPEQLLSRVMIDYCYFLATGGGVTFGGGESLLYADAIMDFIKLCPVGLSTNVETSLNVSLSEEVLRKLGESVCQFIIDIKTWDDALYESYTGVSGERMKTNLLKIRDLGFQSKCTVRIPVIPKLKTKEQALEEEKLIRSLGFEKVSVFSYVIRDYME